MVPDDPPELTRRALRDGTDGASGTTLTRDDPPAGAVPSTTTMTLAEPASAHVALTWVDDTRVAPRPAAQPDANSTPDLIGRPPRRSPFRAAVVVPFSLVALVLGAYAATTLLWPLHSVPPTVEAVGLQPAVAPAAAPAWPGVGSAGVEVVGIGSLASSPDAASIASITKVVTALVVLEEMPLDVGEQGPEFRFTSADRSAYWRYRGNGESALDVPVGGSLTQYQMLEGMLVGSANNYADRLATTLWPTDAVFAAAANSWLQTHGVAGVTVAEPTGLDARNVATPEALLVLAEKALANPVIAEIVRKPSVELPGVGVVENTNGLLADPGALGIKTGTLDSWNLLAAKDAVIGDVTVRLYASVLGQPGSEERLAATRALFAQLEAELQPQTAIPAGTMVGRVTTAWGDDVPIDTAADASVILWNGGTATTAPEFTLGDARAAGAEVGSLVVTGPLNGATVALELDGEITEPSPWWRMTHPLELWGLTD
ncbi:D-alanyl-D-alanine carboxypeptidase family protein [Microbacterium sp. SLBN-146]|uniref:D-alanyl-D-alanine carboxypeptidase family protein n=1 Tax=Microbacterium sp. SLBN-146 TaxID=2768457 RepID=UPI00114DDB8D|nr:D-alanyl-D-alanine carboxypeptidase [Microbacterium sp. SLBN-146]TQJ30183.1 D-alanyl-D-alanine carboxypeptidase (penicillin-binding protein 5/6) [Microbacterium sp. SLBN-146]